MPSSSHPGFATPVEAAEAALAAFDAHDWAHFVPLVHADALAQFRRAVLEGRQREEFILDHADLYRDIVPEEFVESQRTYLRRVFRLDSWDEAERMSAPALYAQYLGSGHAIPPGEGATFGTSRTVLGAVHQGPDVAHVVFLHRHMVPEEVGETQEMEIVERTDARVLTVMRAADGAWRVMLNGGLFFDESGGFGMACGFGGAPPDRGRG